jgi:hypothetical protein
LPVASCSCHDGSMHWQFVILVPGVRTIFFGDPFGLGLDSPMLTRGTAANVLNRVEEFIIMCERHHHQQRRAHQLWRKQSFFPTRSLREKRGLDGFSVCPSTVHSWRTDTRGRPAHTLEDYGLTIAVRLILPTVEINR